MYHFRRFYIPERMMPGLKMWIEHGKSPGGFLRAVLENDLIEALRRADDENLANLPAFVAYLYNEAPALCWGSAEKVKAWPDVLAQEEHNAHIAEANDSVQPAQIA